MITVPSKICTKCKLVKPRTDFYKRPERGDNAIKPQCKKCVRKKLDNLFKPKYKTWSIEKKKRRSNMRWGWDLKNKYGINC